jgi:hypothetical protein
MKINWQKVTLNIQNNGVPLTPLSLKLGKHKGYLPQLARGEVKEPRFSDGLVLLDIHLDVCGLEKHSELMPK